jgi:hypothetical protein
VDDGRQCRQCGRSLEGRRSDATFCRQRCRKRYGRRRPPSNYTEPPSVSTDGPSEYGADNRWRQQYARHEEASEPLTDHERQLLDRQRRNPGVLLPELARLQLDRAIEQQRREQADARLPIMVEDPYHPESLGSLQRRARYDRKLNKPQDPHLAVMRPGPGRSGPPGWNDLPECIDGDAIGWRR